MNRRHAVLALCVMWSCTAAPSEGARHADSASVERASVQVYDAIWPAVDTMLSETWDGKYGHPLRLDRRALVPRGGTARDGGDIVTAAEAERWIAQGYVIGQCPPLAANGRCETAGALLIVQLSPVILRGDSAEVELGFYGDQFGATWEILLARDGMRWKVRSRRMTMIT